MTQGDQGSHRAAWIGFWGTIIAALITGAVAWLTQARPSPPPVNPPPQPNPNPAPDAGRAKDLERRAEEVKKEIQRDLERKAEEVKKKMQKVLEDLQREGAK